MGGIFGAISNENCVADVFFGTDYHSHLGTKRGGMAMYSKELGFQRSIHNIQNSPFRTKFENDFNELEGNIGIGCISDTDPQPQLVRSNFGSFAITTVGRINNITEITQEIFKTGKSHFMEQSGGKINPTEVVAALIATKEDIVEGIHYAQEKIEGSMTMLVMTSKSLYASRDKYGRTPLIIGKKDGAHAVSFESFAYKNLGYHDEYELGPNEIVKIKPDRYEVVHKASKKMKICAFLWTYYGYTTSSYEGINVEEMRYRCGRSLADFDKNLEVDYIAGVPDSGIAHAIGYANKAGVPYARPLIKYTPTWPRSFMPPNQSVRNLVARMKLISVDALIKDKKLLFIDDSIVRGTQMSETVEYLYDAGAKEVHVRSACPPIMYGCKYLNFSRATSDMDLMTHRVMQKLEGDKYRDFIDLYVDQTTPQHKRMVDEICKELNFTSLGFHEVNELIKSIGLDPECICTYCWTGKE